MSDPLYSSAEPSSQSNPQQVKSCHIKLEWTLDFDNRSVHGLVEHVFQILEAGTAEVCLDSKMISITDDVYINESIVAKYQFGESHPIFGQKLAISIPEDLRYEGSQFCVTIPYKIGQEASAVQWLDAAATKGGKYPFVFTQSQAIHARSLLPCMDHPGVKTPYTAVVTAPSWCTVLMSALSDTANTIVAARTPVKPKQSISDHHKFSYVQPVPTSAYLIALAAGELESREISDRVRVWSEPAVIAQVHYEFAETEEFLKAAEEITGCPYQWQRYDVLCLPPSFPYGGMENPCLTFATPTLLAGDRSLADVIAHEIAHSWTGNLVTNQTWDHFWLNEGWTVWLERKITSRVKKNDEVGKLSAQIGYKHFEDDVDRMKHDNPFTALVWQLAGVDPDDAYTSVPYEKGFNFLTYLENIVGSDHFSAFTMAYIDEFKFRSVTTGAFRDFFVKFMKERLSSGVEQALGNSTGSASAGGKKKGKKGKKDAAAAAAASSEASSAIAIAAAATAIAEKLDSLDWNALFMSPGMPSYTNDFANSLSTSAISLSEQWISVRNAPTRPSAGDDLQNWSSQQICIFLEELLHGAKEVPFSNEFLKALDKAYQFTKSKNSEVRFRWQSLCIRSNVSWIYAPTVEFITEQGRMKFVRPLYRALRASSIGGPRVAELYEAHKNSYHPIAKKMIEADLRGFAEQEAKSAAPATASDPVSDPVPVPVPAVVEPKEEIIASPVTIDSAPVKAAVETEEKVKEEEPEPVSPVKAAATDSAATVTASVTATIASPTPEAAVEAPKPTVTVTAAAAESPVVAPVTKEASIVAPPAVTAAPVAAAPAVAAPALTAAPTPTTTAPANKAAERSTESSSQAKKKSTNASEPSKSSPSINNNDSRKSNATVSLFSSRHVVWAVFATGVAVASLFFFRRSRR